MTPEQLLALDARSRALCSGDRRPPREDLAFYGYHAIDIFDCPPFTMFTNNDCPRVFEFRYDGSFEPGSMRLWCHLARQATGILDVGAHVGVFSLAAGALRPDIPIHAFEPNLFALSRLRINRDINAFTNIQEHYCAVAQKQMVTTLTTGTDKGSRIYSGGNILTPPGPDSGTQTVVFAGPLDDFGIDVGDRGLIKIDVEGAEHLVFEGMKGVLQRRPDIILETFSPANAEKIDTRIRDLGYRVFRILEAERRLVPVDTLLAADRQGSNLNQFLTVRDPPPLL